MDPSLSTIDAFSALALQVKCQAVNRASDRTTARTIMQAAINALGPQLAAAKAFPISIFKPALL